MVELVPDQPGPRMGGESLTVDVWLSLDQDYPYDVRLWYVQLDFSDTDPALALDPEFGFDFSSLPDPSGYFATTYPELPVPHTANTLDIYLPELWLLLPQDGLLHIGSIGAELPTVAGVYRVDALNADEPDELFGALIRTWPFGAEWRAFTGEITGGPYGFVVIPEPGTLALLTLAAVTVGRRRAGSTRRCSFRKRVEGARTGVRTGSYAARALSCAAPIIAICVGRRHGSHGAGRLTGP